MQLEAIYRSVARPNMSKVLSEEIGGFKGTVYLMSLGYTYKITYHRKVVDQSYVYLVDENLAIERMKNSLRMLSGFNKDLFDLEKL